MEFDKVLRNDRKEQVSQKRKVYSMLIFFSFFSRDSFLILEIFKHFFMMQLPLNVMVPNEPLLDNSQTLRSYCPCV